MAKSEGSRRITVRLDKDMVRRFAALQQELEQRNGSVTDAVLARLLMRQALGTEASQAAVAESAMFLYRLNQKMFNRMQQILAEEGGFLDAADE